jgi:hypothetical protein
MRTKRWLIAELAPVVAVICIIAFCFWRTAKADGAKVIPTPPSSLTFKPVKFLDGQQSVLISHLDLTTGALEIDTGGAEVWFTVNTDVWEEGKKPRWVGGNGSRMKGKTVLSISVKKLQDQDGDEAYAVVVNDQGDEHSGTSRQVVPLTKSKPQFHATCTRLEELDKPIELKEGNEAILWAYTINTSGRSGGGSLKEDYLTTMSRVISIRFKWAAKYEDLRD